MFRFILSLILASALASEVLACPTASATASTGASVTRSRASSVTVNAAARPGVGARFAAARQARHEAVAARHASLAASASTVAKAPARAGLRGSSSVSVTRTRSRGGSAALNAQLQGAANVGAAQAPFSPSSAVPPAPVIKTEAGPNGVKTSIEPSGPAPSNPLE